MMYMGSILSMPLVNIAHEIHHLLAYTIHLHHHHDEPVNGNSETAGDGIIPLRTHDHKHNDFIDTALQAVNEKENLPKNHVLIFVELFNHLSVRLFWKKPVLPDDPG